MGEYIGIASLAMQGLGMIQQQSQADAQQSAAAAQQAAELRQTYQQQAVEDRRRREQLKKDQAAQRARFGAQGVGGGSAQAVLDGLRARSDQEAADSRSILNARLGIGQQDAEQTKRGVLEEARARQQQVLARFIGD